MAGPIAPARSTCSIRKTCPHRRFARVIFRLRNREVGRRPGWDLQANPVMNTWKLPDKWVELPREPFLTPNPDGKYRVPLRVDEPSGVQRISHPVTSGVPIPEGVLNDAKDAR